VDHAVWADALSPAHHAALTPGVPDRLDRRPDVLVVGGGVVGLVTAVACRAAGLGRVVVLEREPRLAPAASGGNGGALAPDMHALTDPAAFVAFGRASLARYRELDALWDGAIGVRATRWLQLFEPGTAPPPGAPPGARRLDAAAIRELEPDVAVADGTTALLVPGQGAVNPQRLAAVLAGHAGTVATGVAVHGVEQRGGRITAVHTGLGDFQPGAVVMATGLVPGPWSEGVPQRWVKGHMVAVGPGRARGSAAAARPPWRLGSVLSSPIGGGAPQPGGGIVCGGTFDDDTAPVVRPEIVAQVLAGLHRLLPAARSAPATHRWYCLRPVVDGRHPVIDRLPGTANGWVSAGHFTTGVMMAAGTGRALAEWIGSGRRPPDVATFGLEPALRGRTRRTRLG
jgi:glycine oxidase